MNFKILDTGYISNDTLTELTQLQVSSRAGYDGTSSVNSFNIGSISINRARQVSTDNNSVINNTTQITTNLVSVRNPIWTFNIQIERTVSNTGYNNGFLLQLLRLEETYGLKLLYPSSVTDNAGFLTTIEMIGEKNNNGNFSSATPTDTAGTISQNIPYLIGRIKFGTIPDGNNSSNLIIPCTFEESE